LGGMLAATLALIRLLTGSIGGVQDV
jgi:hypothetical protein